MDPKLYKKTNTAAYFKWFHKFQVWNEETKKYELKLDLTKYQIYTKNQKIQNFYKFLKKTLRINTEKNE